VNVLVGLILFRQFTFVHVDILSGYPLVFGCKSRSEHLQAGAVLNAGSPLILLSGMLYSVGALQDDGRDAVIQ
jgi:hypothetical protein